MVVRITGYEVSLRKMAGKLRLCRVGVEIKRSRFLPSWKRVIKPKLPTFLFCHLLPKLRLISSIRMGLVDSMWSRLAGLPAK